MTYGKEKGRGASVGEFELIAKLTKGAPSSGGDLLCGVGDDCAVIKGHGGKDWLITTDVLIEDIHFRRGWSDFKTIGRKAMAVNLSDIAAMGGVPRFYLVTIGIPGHLETKAIEEIYEGIREEAGRFDVVLIGGDTSASSTSLIISPTVIGEIQHDKCLFRRGARPGDSVYVTGTLGSAALGRGYLEKGVADDFFVSRFLVPEPRIAVGEALAASGFVTAMIDVSDGLVADLGHIAQMSKVGFEIESAKLPFDDGFSDRALSIGAVPASLALTGGEDYELVFTVDSRGIADFEKVFGHGASGVRVTKIGRISADAGRRVVFGQDGKELHLERSGFDHLWRRS